MLNSFCGFRIVTNPYMGETVCPHPPDRIKAPGPYRTRRICRWYRSHPCYTMGDGTFLLAERDGVIFCHPDDLPKLRAAMNLEVPDHD